MNNKTKISPYFIWIFVILSIICVISISMNFFQKYQNANCKKVTVASTPCNCASIVSNTNLDSKYNTFVSHFFNYKFNYPKEYYVNDDYNKYANGHNWEDILIVDLVSGESKGDINIESWSDNEKDFSTFDEYVEDIALSSFVGYSGVNSSAHADKILNKVIYKTKNGIEVIKCDINETHSDKAIPDVVFGPFYFLNLTQNDGIIRILSVSKDYLDNTTSSISDEVLNDLVESVEKTNNKN